MEKADAVVEGRLGTAFAQEEGFKRPTAAPILLRAGLSLTPPVSGQQVKQHPRHGKQDHGQGPCRSDRRHPLTTQHMHDDRHDNRRINRKNPFHAAQNGTLYAKKYLEFQI